MGSKMKEVSQDCVPQLEIKVETPNNANAEKEVDEHIVPHNNLPVVFFALMLAAFLAALDQTIVATALPTIVAELGGGNNYSWVASAYLIVAAAMCPVYGKLSEIFGRKLVLYPSIALFLVGSALCGVAQSMTWLIAARTIQGIGGGGIVQLVQIIIADIVSLEEQGTYGASVSAMWAIAGVAGPLIGGALTDHLSWRWCFWINLPTGGVAGLLLLFFLNLNPHQGKSLTEHIRQFDFVGLALIVSGVLCLLLGFNRSDGGWHAPATIALLVIGFVTLILGGINEVYTKRSPIVPPRLFQTRTTGLLLVTVFFHYLAFFSAAFYLPLYFQVLGASATKSGLLIIPFSLLSSVGSATGSITVAKMGDYRPIMRVGYTIMAIGYGLMIMLNDHTSIALQLTYPAIAGFGLGLLFIPPLLGLQAAMPVKDMPTTTTTDGLFRSLGSTLGASVGQTIWTGELRRKLGKIPNLNLDLSGGALSQAVRTLYLIEPLPLRLQVIRAYTASISTIWLVNTPIICCCFIAVLFLKPYTLKRKVVRNGKPKGEETLDSATNEYPFETAKELEECLDEKEIMEEGIAPGQ
ncbi:major facilitator superfamily domain-containing protein [Mycena capillaripes]|nr:major facilitator superfamily domain-containing protein [Mycena capillaripes]